MAKRVLKLAALVLAFAVSVTPAVGQRASIVVVDLEEALSESAVGRALTEIEGRERRALRSELDVLKAELEAEEAELVKLREALDKEAFDVRTRAFDQRVREERRRAQEAVADLQARFKAAREALRRATQPALAELMQARGAVVALARDQVVAVAPAVDLTQALTQELDRRRPAATAAGLLPPP